MLAALGRMNLKQTFAQVHGAEHAEEITEEFVATVVRRRAEDRANAALTAPCASWAALWPYFQEFREQLDLFGRPHGCRTSRLDRRQAGVQPLRRVRQAATAGPEARPQAPDQQAGVLSVRSRPLAPDEAPPRPVRHAGSQRAAVGAKHTQRELYEMLAQAVRNTS